MMTQAGLARTQCARQKAQSQAGFSLLELLIVLLIIGFMTKMVSFSGAFGQDELETNALKIYKGINLASEYAVLNQVELGVHIADNTVSFLLYDGEAWQIMDEPSVFSAISLPETVALELTLDDLPGSEENLLEQVDWRALIGADQDESLLELDKAMIPHIMLLSSGDLSPFQIQLNLVEDDSYELTITGEFMAPVSLRDSRDEDNA